MIASIMFLPNGNTAVFNEKGLQLPEYQKSWLVTFIKTISATSTVDPERIAITLPDGRKARLFRIEKDIWNWEVLS